MTEQTDIKTRADGSIDTAHYMAQGREMRSRAFWAMLLGMWPRARGLRKVAVKAPSLPRPLSPARTPV